MSPHPRLNRAMAAAALGVAAVLLAGACAKTDQPAMDTTTGAATGMMVDTAKPGAAATTLTDAQIAHVVVTANSIDSTAGEMAKQKGSAQAVKEFAQTMITDHSAVNQQAVALATKLNITPEDNDVNRQLKSGADQSNGTRRPSRPTASGDGWRACRAVGRTTACSTPT